MGQVGGGHGKQQPQTEVSSTWLKSIGSLGWNLELWVDQSFPHWALAKCCKPQEGDKTHWEAWVKVWRPWWGQINSFAGVSVPWKGFIWLCDPAGILSHWRPVKWGWQPTKGIRSGKRPTVLHAAAGAAQEVSAPCYSCHKISTPCTGEEDTWSLGAATAVG